jgi:hypothetical protein
MTIDTKYKIGDEVWVRPTNYIEKGIIESIDVSARMEYGIITRKCVSYDVKIDNCLFTFYEHGLFPTKEELLNNL